MIFRYPYPADTMYVASSGRLFYIGYFRGVMGMWEVLGSQYRKIA